MAAIESTKWETNLISEFIEYQRLQENFDAIKSKNVRAVVRYFEMRTAAGYINNKVDRILNLYKKLPEPLQSKHNDTVKQVSDESKEINDDVIIVEGQKLFTKNAKVEHQSLSLSSAKTRKFVIKVTPRKTGNTRQLMIVKRPASPLNSPKRRSSTFSLMKLKGSASAFKFKLSSEIVKYHQLYEGFIAIEGSKIKSIVRRYEMSKIAQNLNKQCEQIMNIRKELSEQEQSKNDAIIKQVLDNHARIKTIIKSEQDKSADQKFSTPKRKASKYGFLNKRRDSKRDSTPRKTPRDLKLKTPKKMKSSFALARKVSTELSSDNPKKTEEKKESKLHDWYSFAMLKLKVKAKGTK